MILSINEIIRTFTVLIQLFLGVIVCIEAKRRQNDYHRQIYYLIGLTFILDGLVFFPTLVGIEFSEVPFPYPLIPPFLTAVWATKIFSARIHPNTLKFIYFLLMSDIVLTTILTVFDIDLWFIFYLLGMYRISLFTIGMVLLSFHNRKEILSEPKSNLILSSQLAFSILRVGILSYFIFPIVSYSLFFLLKNEPEIITHFGISLGVVLMGWALFEEVSFSESQTIKALCESEEKYRNLIERANDGIAIIQDGRNKFINSILK